MQNEGHEFKTYKKTLKAKIVEFTAVRVSSMAAGNIGKMLRKMNVNLEAKAARNLSSVLTDERNRMAAKIGQNEQRAAYISEPSNIGQMAINKVVEEKHNIEYENAKLKVEVKELNYQINKNNPFVLARGLNTKKDDNINSKLNPKQLLAAKDLLQKVRVDAPVTKSEEVDEKLEYIKSMFPKAFSPVVEIEVKSVVEPTTSLVPVEDITKEIVASSTSPIKQQRNQAKEYPQKEIVVSSEDLTKQHRDQELAGFNQSRQEIIKPVEKPTVNVPTSEQDGLEGFEFLEELTRNIKAQKKENTNLTKDNNELRSELAIKTAQLSEGDERRKAVGQSLEDTLQLLDKTEEETRTMKKEMQASAAKAITERNDLLAQNKQAEARLQTTTEENQQLREQLVEANQTVALITKDRDKLKNDNVSDQKIAVDRAQAAAVENNQLKGKLEALNSLIDSITKDKDAALNQVKRYQTGLQSLRTECLEDRAPIEQSDSKQM